MAAKSCTRGKKKCCQNVKCFKHWGYSGEKEEQVLGMSFDEKNLYSPSLIPFWDAFNFILPLHADLFTPT